MRILANGFEVLLRALGIPANSSKEKPSFRGTRCLHERVTAFSNFKSLIKWRRLRNKFRKFVPFFLGRRRGLR